MSLLYRLRLASVTGKLLDVFVLSAYQPPDQFTGANVLQPGQIEKLCVLLRR